MKILICGANGFLGHRVLEQAINLGWEVDCFVHHNTNRINYYSSKIHKLIFYIKDIQNIYDKVFLLNTKISYNEFSVDNKLDANIKVPMNIIEKCKDAFFVYSSSITIYKDHSTILTESSLPNYWDPFRFMPELLMRLTKKFAIIRLSSIIGSEMDNDRFLPLIIKNARDKGIIELFGDGSRKQNYLPVNDAVDYIIQAAILDAHGIFLGVYPLEYSNIEIANIVKSNIANTKILFRGEDKTPSFTFNNEYTRNILNKKIFLSIEESIKKIIAE